MKNSKPTDMKQNSDLNSVQYAEIEVTALPADPKTTLIKRYE